MHNIYFLII